MSVITVTLTTKVTVSVITVTLTTKVTVSIITASVVGLWYPYMLLSMPITLQICSSAILY